ncbi:hypothetical protein K488DRAFT_74748 [Vararia minispora EC-137]|uniref:Uncharacterized protein n=1 Tax=Vararia minispora EC-137 TaxID=1314806 RepID=A0ACB8Q649_9AGAM|nr:hypothetical protein K488DRAFT_74748 [Vararia minispora EC-137]
MAHAGSSVSLSISFTNTGKGTYYNFGPYERLKAVSEPTSDGQNGPQPLSPPNIDDLQEPADQCLFIKGIQVGQLTRHEKRKFRRSKIAGQGDRGRGHQDSAAGHGGAGGSSSGTNGDGTSSGNTGSNGNKEENNRSGTNRAIEAGQGPSDGYPGDESANIVSSIQSSIDGENRSDDPGGVSSNTYGDEGSESEELTSDEGNEENDTGDAESYADILPGISTRLKEASISTTRGPNALLINRNRLRMPGHYSDAEIAVVRDHDLRPYWKEIEDGVDLKYVLAQNRPPVLTFVVDSGLLVTNSTYVKGSLSKIDEDLLHARIGSSHVHSDISPPDHSMSILIVFTSMSPRFLGPPIYPTPVNVNIKDREVRYRILVLR